MLTHLNGNGFKDYLVRDLRKLGHHTVLGILNKHTFKKCLFIHSRCTFHFHNVYMPMAHY